MKWAIVNDNRITEIVESDEFPIRNCQLIFEIDGTPQVGWVIECNRFVPFNERALIPDVTPRQMRQALILSSVSIPTIEAAINSLPSPNKELAMTEWEYSIAFKRMNHLVDAIGLIVGKTPEEVDNIWRLAKTL